MIYLTKSMTMQKAVYEFISQQNNPAKTGQAIQSLNGKSVHELERSLLFFSQILIL